jgi:aspartate oxidase
VADFFHAPDIKEVDLNAYSVQVGDVIRIKVTDDFSVQQVSVKIENADATFVEKGQAILSPDGLSWIYTATAANESMSGDKITVTATDRPQNVSREEQVIE